MAQNYLWKVTYSYDKTAQFYKSPYNSFKTWTTGSKVFKNKLNAMNFVIALQNDKRFRNVSLKKWTGT